MPPEPQVDSSAETLLFQPNRSGAVSVCLAYPNSYRVAMGNLGYQLVWRILATTPGVLCERLFMDGGARREGTLESGRSPGDFDIVAFSLSFESDYPNVVRMLMRAGIPPRAAARGGGRPWPLLLAGGPATFLNPEPMAPFFDIFLIGEAEEMLPEAFAGAPSWAGLGFDGLLDRLAAVAGAYRPEQYRPWYTAEGELGGLDRDPGAPSRIERRWVENLDLGEARSAALAPEAVFGGSFLVEAGRGCEWGCRFCAAGFIYRPVRHRHSERVAADCLYGLKHRPAVGLIGAEMGSHPGLAQACAQVGEAGGRLSPSSMRADMVGPRLAEALASMATRSVTVAPEAGSRRMRRVINKNLSEDEILRAVELLSAGGVESLKLYFMCALPGETDEDLEAIAELVGRIRERAAARAPAIKVSVNPFVPKPWTPFQWEPMVGVTDGRRRIAFLRRALSRLDRVEVDCDSPREAYLQTLFSRGDRRVADLIEALAGGRDWWARIQATRKGEHSSLGFDPDRFVHRRWREREVLPWDIIDNHIEKEYLWAERGRAMNAEETRPCDVSACRVCGAC